MGSRLPIVIVILCALAGCRGSQGNTRTAFPQTGPLSNLFILQDTKTARLSSWDRTGGNYDFITIASGETKPLADISGIGVVRRFYIAVIASDRMTLRKLVLRMYWDGAKDPAVEVPLGDFFGSGLGTLRRFHSVAVDVNPGFSMLDFDGMVSYLPMPFANGARITVENDGGVKDAKLFYQIDYEQYPKGAMPANAGRLHALWHRVSHTPVVSGKPKNSQFGNMTARNTTGGDNFVVLDIAGRGSFVGLFLTVDNIAGGWYGEGDDMIFVDGAKWPPTYPGTGHEEIFGAGAIPDQEFAGLYTGFYLIENYKGLWGGKNQMYRFYVDDPIRFRKSLKFTIEHGHDNNFENDYTSTAFWYQDEQHKPLPPLPPAAERVPTWPPGVADAIECETYLRLQVATPVSRGIVPLSGRDLAQWQELEGARDKDFRALRYDDFIRDVSASEKIIARYPEYRRAQRCISSESYKPDMVGEAQ
jgi:hypothetical protein